MHKNHMLIMLICCLIPAVLAGIFLLNIPERSIFPIAMFLICPLLHLAMMRMMTGEHHKH